MKVQPLINGKAPPRISRKVLQHKARWMSWFFAWFFLLMGIVGTLIVCNGGIGNIRAGNITIGGSILAILLQLILTGTQWLYGDNRLIAYPSRAIDATLTAAGYGSLVVPALTNVLLSVNLPQPDYVAWCITWFLSLLIAYQPEHRLVGDK